MDPRRGARRAVAYCMEFLHRGAKIAIFACERHMDPGKVRITLEDMEDNIKEASNGGTGAPEAGGTLLKEENTWFKPATKLRGLVIGSSLIDSRGTWGKPL